MSLDFKMQLCDGFLVVLESGASSGLLLQMLRNILTSHLQCHAILIAPDAKKHSYQPSTMSCNPYYEVYIWFFQPPNMYVVFFSIQTSS